MGYLVPTPFDPVPWLILVGDFDASYPLGLFHAVAVRQPDSEWEAVVKRNGMAVPSVSEHDSFVGRNQVKVNRFVKSVARGHDDVAGFWPHLRIRQNLLQA